MTTSQAFDPEAALPGPPDPWASTDTPTRRSGPPYHMTDMIAAEPAVARRIIERVTATGDADALSAAVRAAATTGRPIVTTGCGTSEHGALAVADILREAMAAAGVDPVPVVTAQAFELSLAPPSAGLVIGITHEGGTGATNAALRAARAAGARTAVITASRRSPAGALADVVVETLELDQSWCHTVGYLSPIVAAAAAGAALSGRPLDAAAVAALLSDGTRDTATAERIAARAADVGHCIVIASGADRTAGRELVLKVEEASWLPSAFRDLETFLHGHLPATGHDTALVLILADRDGRVERIARARQVLAAARVIGLRSAAIVTAEVDALLEADLTPAGRSVVAEAPDLPAPVAALLATATPLQLFTERLARARGTDPDPIRRDDPVYLAASEAADRA